MKKAIALVLATAGILIAFVTATTAGESNSPAEARPTVGRTWA